MSDLDYGEMPEPAIKETQYLIRQVMPANGYQYVVAEISGDDGETKLAAVPLHFLGVVSVVTKTYKDETDKELGYWMTRHQQNTIAGVELIDGVNDLCPICDSDNYALAPAEKVYRLKYPHLSDHDWLQIEQAARGCVSGNSDEWPHLVKAIQKITGHQLTRKSATWLQGFCQGILS